MPYELIMELSAEVTSFQNTLHGYLASLHENIAVILHSCIYNYYGYFKKTFTCNWYLFATGVIEMSSGSRRIKCQICGQVQYWSTQPGEHDGRFNSKNLSVASSYYSSESADP